MAYFTKTEIIYKETEQESRIWFELELNVKDQFIDQMPCWMHPGKED